MGSRSRKRRRPTVGDAAFTPRERVPSSVRDEQVRAGLEPIRPGERPRPLVIAAAVAAALSVLNLVLFAAGYDIRGGEDPTVFGVVLFSVVMAIAAAGIWTLRYWAVLGFQCLLAITAVYAALALAVASNLRAVLLCIGIMVGAGWLFWKLIRVMARLQMPRRPGDART